MYDFFKNIAETNGWVFEYGRKDYQNLYNEDVSGGTIHLFVDPIVIDSSFSNTGNETKSYSGRFMMILSSDVDEMYDDKFNDYIKPLFNGALQTIKDTLVCDDYDINKFQTLEVINLLDFNLDGVLVNYSLSPNE
ncbi:hypothetical protein LZZ90_08335 [Flavobacterium sp. SM15]|uniref:hypothetical protein n=1 Tax=Flavobacterium sp. SM15 TaxID=2908005 RepID=UPI001EDBA617|nr:hypothetical protein [Flavobacterium sp. SM15]MCG2611514.1 hypothetical protein [Flavobacterium sp. SM15]